MTEDERLEEIERIAKGTFSTWTDKPRPHVVDGVPVYDRIKAEVSPRSTSDGLDGVSIKISLEQLLGEEQFRLFELLAAGISQADISKLKDDPTTGKTTRDIQNLYETLRNNKWRLS
jgi:hypothetical protein